MLFYHFSSAQSSLVPPNCYATYKNRGDNYKAQKNLPLAVQQYEIARNCNYLTNFQRIQLDSLIGDIKRKLQPVKEIKIRRGV